jgi:hypothetical protein
MVPLASTGMVKSGLAAMPHATLKHSQHSQHSQHSRRHKHSMEGCTHRALCGRTSWRPLMRLHALWPRPEHEWPTTSGAFPMPRYPVGQSAMRPRPPCRHAISPVGMVVAEDPLRPDHEHDWQDLCLLRQHGSASRLPTVRDRSPARPTEERERPMGSRWRGRHHPFSASHHTSRDSPAHHA